MEFGSGLWIVDGPTVTAAGGFRYPTRMAVIRLADGGLLVWSPVALDDALRQAIDALGPVRCLVAPNALHHVFLGEWRRAYPEALTFAAPGLREKRRDIAFDGVLGDGAPAAWAGEIDQVVLRGNLITTEVVFFHRRSRTVLFCDLLQQLPRDWFNGWRAIVARLDLMVGSEASVPRKFRLAFIDRRAARDGLERILSWPFEKVLMAHGEPIAADGQMAVRRAFRWLL